MLLSKPCQASKGVLLADRRGHIWLGKAGGHFHAPAQGLSSFIIRTWGCKAHCPKQILQGVSMSEQPSSPQLEVAKQNGGI